MKLSTIAIGIGSAAKIMNSATSMAMLVGFLYLIDCRSAAKTSEMVDKCYFTAIPMMGIGIAGKGGFNVGYNTLNPLLRKEDQDSQDQQSGDGGRNS